MNQKEKDHQIAINEFLRLANQIMEESNKRNEIQN